VPSSLPLIELDVSLSAEQAVRPAPIYENMTALEEHLIDSGICTTHFRINELAGQDGDYVLIWNGKSGECYWHERGVQFDKFVTGDRRLLVDRFCDMLSERYRADAQQPVEEVESASGHLDGQCVRVLGRSKVADYARNAGANGPLHRGRISAGTRR